MILNFSRTEYKFHRTNTWHSHTTFDTEHEGFVSVGGSGYFLYKMIIAALFLNVNFTNLVLNFSRHC